MRKKKRIISICMAALVMLLAIAGCGKKEDITGKWVFTEEETGETAAMELFSDGSGIYTAEGVSYSCAWITENGRLKIEIDAGMFGKSSLVADYEIDGDKLILSDEDGAVTFIRE
ncbi:MAG: hypothetical protein HDR21_13270 [Lachnospiraceae bacterium]|nr:hypothetical protein [Lachnospiraceae bacterium]